MNTEQLRAAFEPLVYQRYLAQRAAGRAEGDEVEVLTPEGVLWRTADGGYGVNLVNAAWWGYLAGASGAAPAGIAGVPRTPASSQAASTAICLDIGEHILAFGGVGLRTLALAST